MRNALKSSLYTLAFFLRTIARLFVREPEVVILMYHAVDNSGWKHAIAPEKFRAQIQYLRAKKRLVPLADVVAYARGEKELPHGSVALTFDDGYAGLKDALLDLMAQEIPVTLFIPSDTSVPTNSAGFPRLSWDELRTLAHSPLFSIQAHSRTHRKLTQLSPSECDLEIRGSADDIERELGRRSEYFAFPYGDKNPDVVKAVRSAGYEAAFAITEGVIRPGDNVFTLKRVQVDATINAFLFKVRLTRAVDIHRRIVDFLGLR